MLTKIGVGQFQITRGDLESNYHKAESLIKLAAIKECELILLPELWLGGYDYTHLDAYIAQSRDYLSVIQNMSSSLHIAIAGTYPVKVNNQLYNKMVYFDPTGDVYDYNKIHLFSLMKENKYFSPGDDFCSFSKSWGKVGMAICYDLRFPEVFRKYALNGVTVIIISAEWPQKRSEHWRTLLKARAIENQVFIIGCNAVGKSGNEIMGGGSSIIDPWGNILAEAGSEKDELITATIDMKFVNNARDTIPVQKDRRPDIYG
jgi:predicted amidohydrolase